MNYAVNRLFVRLALLSVAIVMGALAVAQAQRGLGKSSAGTTTAPQALATLSETPAQGLDAYGEPTGPQAIPLQDPVPPPQSVANYPDGSGEAFQPDGQPVIPSTDYQSQPYSRPPAQYAESTGPPTVDNQAVPPMEYTLPPPLAGSNENAAADYSPPALSDSDVRQAQVEVQDDRLASRYSDPPPAPVQDDYQPAPMDPNLNAPNLPPLEPPSSPRPAKKNRLRDQEAQIQIPDPPIDSTPSDFAQEESFGGDASLAMSSRRNRRRTRSEEDLASAGTGQPGPEELQGPQTPSLTVSKSAPREVQVGKAARLDVKVRNVGGIVAQDVVIRDEVPRGSRLVDTVPAASVGPDGSVVWQVGSIEPNNEVVVSMNVMPTEEGEIGSVATVLFQVAATARSVATKPQLQLEQTGPRQVLIGQDVLFNIRLSNPGTGIASNVVLQADVPDGLRHYDGRELEFRVGTLKPGETRVLELKLTADRPGVVRNIVRAQGDADLAVQADAELEVIAPDLRVEIDGPKKRFLDRKATYAITLANPGTAAAGNVQLVAKLPSSMKFVSTNNAGRYDAGRHAVTWQLESLPPQEMGTVELTALPTQMGRVPIRVEARANMGLADQAVQEVEVEGLAALLFSVTDVNDPIEVGGETSYEIHVINQGSKTATNLRLAALVPAGMEPLRGDGPARARIEGQKVLFDPLPRLAPDGDSVYRIHVRGIEPGDMRIQVKVASDDITEPVTKEESTHVYSDE